MSPSTAGPARIIPEFTPAAYDELRWLAARFLRRESANHTLQPTALVHEAFIQLAEWKEFQFHGRAQFFGAAAFAMRRVLAAAGRRKRSQKRGLNLIPVSLDETDVSSSEALFDVLAIDLALQRFEQIYRQASLVLEVRVFGGLTIEETAEFLHISPATVKRHWIAARAWLVRELTAGV